MIPVQLWAALILLQAFLFCLVLSRRQKPAQAVLSAPVWLAVFGWTTTMTFLGLSVVWGGIAGHLLSLLVTGPTAKLLLLSVWFSLWAALQAKYPERASHYINYFISASIWLVTFILACQLAQWMDSLVTPVMNYWNILADAFLHGRAYLIDPVKTFDMTFYNGQWYIPLPPLPAFLLAPFVALWGVAAINTTIFSLALSSTTAVLLFLTLAELSSRHWIELSRAGMVWLVLLFSFGSVQLWLSISSQVWYFSQVSTILFVALAFYFAVKRRPAWLTGLALALAVTGRPNGFVLWPALLCITLQIQIESDQGFSWKRLIAWAAGSSIPVVVAVGFLLYYNDIRFGNYLDFGYATVNGASWVVRNVQQYGMFNLHFVSNNLQTGFLAPPDLKASCDYYVPRGNGLSMFAATPAFIYVLRKFKFSWWSLGCWVSMLLSVALLLMYHNNGSVQISYRYVMDFMIPIILVIAFTAGQRISLPLKVLIVLSFLINYYAIISWVHGPC